MAYRYFGSYAAKQHGNDSLSSVSDTVNRQTPLWQQAEGETEEAVMLRRARLLKAFDLAIASLADRQRQVLILLLYDGLSVTEISKNLGITKSVVSHSIKAGIEHIADRLRFCV